jgi:hypothetical protein
MFKNASIIFNNPYCLDIKTEMLMKSDSPPSRF